MMKTVFGLRVLKHLTHELSHQYGVYFGGSLAANYADSRCLISVDSDIDIFILGPQATIDLDPFFRKAVADTVNEIDTHAVPISISMVEILGSDLTGYEILPNQWGHYKYRVGTKIIDVICLNVSIGKLVDHIASDLGRIFYTYQSATNTLELAPASKYALSTINNKIIRLFPELCVSSHYQKIRSRVSMMPGFFLNLCNTASHVTPPLAETPKVTRITKVIEYDDKRII